MLPYLILKTNSWGRTYYYACVIDDENWGMEMWGVLLNVPPPGLSPGLTPDPVTLTTGVTIA